ncbi:bacterial Ig-like domain-containing protein [Lactiplantibacillus songbeiensis]|uniref:Bacterial Ig-like domain-containing protein n=1 Tax=Lactiplantibacillus songbeiensis TaxID=2559920 RepID=A0ABW4C0N0_9LACO|nr:bacterial Ig-like domain-containing protein [Lactiplantibacillus songbeiensis]
MTKQNEKVYYKMYKKGRFWVFAGVAVAAWNVNALMGQAATTADDSSAASVSETTSSSELSQKVVPLNSTSSSDQGSTSDVANGQNTGDTATTKADTTTTTDTDKNAAVDTNDQNKSVTDAAEVTTESSDTSNSASNESGKKETTSNSDEKVQDEAISVESDAANSVSNPTEPEKPITTTPKTPVVTAPATDTNVEQSVNDDHSESEITNPVEDKVTVNVNDLVTDQNVNGLAENDLSVGNANYLASGLLDSAIQAATVQQTFSRKSLMKAAPALTELASGDWGTSHWVLTSDGTLTIGAGTLSDSPAPWRGTQAAQILPDGNLMRSQIRKVVIEPGVIAGKTLSYAFFKRAQDKNNVPLTEIDGLENLDVTNTEDFSQMFSGDKVADFSGVADWSMGQATDTSYMFSSVTAASIPVENWDVSRVTSFIHMFDSNSSLTSIDLSKWQVGTNVATGTTIDLMSMFFLDDNLKSVNVSGWDTSKVKTTTFMFNGAGIESLDLSSWDLRQATSLSSMLFSKTLKSLTLNANTKLTTAVNLPAITAAGYTGKWISLTDSTKKYSSADLMNLYNGQSAPSEVTTYVWEAAPSLSVLTAENKTIIGGPTATWSAKDSVTGLKNAAGEDILATTDVNKAVTVTGNVDPTKKGVYTATLTYVDDAGVTRTADVTITVVDSQSVLVGKEVSVNQGATTWTASDSVDTTQSKDAAGNALTTDELAKVTSTTLDTSKAGSQTVTLTYVDAAGNERTADVTVNVVASQATLTTKDLTIVQGDQASWNLFDHVTGATDFAGNVITDVNNLNITANVEPDLNTVGKTPITLTYTDSEGNQHSYNVTVTVVANGAALEVKDITVTAGPNTTWTIADSLASLTDVDGNAVTDLTTVKLTTNQTPNLTTPGIQTVVITYTDAAGYQHEKTATIKVVASQAKVNATDSTIVMGPNATWYAKDNLTSVIQANGDTVSADDVILENNVKIAAKVMSVMYSYLRTDGTTVTVSGTVDLSKAGRNELTYTYTDSQGNTTTATAIVTVVASQAGVKAKDTTVIQSPNANFNAADQLTTRQDEYGHLVDVSAMTVGGDTVDLSKPGQYTVTYHYVDGAGNVFDDMATITVVATQAKINANDNTVIAGPKASWQLSDSVTAIQNETGQADDLSKVTMTGKVDVTTPGTYPVTLHYTDGQGNQVTKLVTVTVVKSQADLQVKDSTLMVGEAWNATDNIVKVLDATGQTVDPQQVVVTGAVDPTTAGTYPVTYQYTDAAGNLISKTATVTVTANGESGNTG